MLTGAVISGTKVPSVVVDTAPSMPKKMAEDEIGAKATWIVDVGTSGAAEVIVPGLVGKAEDGAAEPTS